MTEQDFLRQLAAPSADNGLLLVFADWLEERGDPRSELIRLNHQVEACGGDDEVERRRKQLAATWAEGLAAIADDGDWINSVMERLPETLGRKFECDCIERVLPVFEQTYPHDHRPRWAVEAKRRYLLGQAIQEELEAARSAALDAHGEALRAIPRWDSEDAAYLAALNVMKAAYAAYTIAARAGWNQAPYYARQVVWHGDGNTVDDSMDIERRWQVGRLCEYLAFECGLRPIGSTTY